MTTQPTPNPEPAPGTPEYDAKMVASFEQRSLGVSPQEEQKEVPALPEGGSEKFYNKETGEYDWKAHATELQYKLDQRGKGDEPKPEDQSEEDAPKDGSDQEVQDVVQRAGLDIDTLRSQIIESGNIDAEAKAALVKSGVPEVLIDEYVSLASAHLEAQTAKAIEYAGGEEAWREMHDWAAQNLSDAEKERVNAMLRSEEWALAIDTIRVRAGAQARPEPRNVRGTQSGRSAVSGYTSRSQMVADMQSEKYRSDAAFRIEVERRIAAATWADDFRR